MNDAVRQALNKTQIVTDGQRYRLAHLPPRALLAAASVLAECATPFCGLLADSDEVTLILPEEQLVDFSDRLPGSVVSDSYALITFTLPLEHTMIGFLAAVSEALAAAQVPVMAYSAYKRDHLLVPQHLLQAALSALAALRQQARWEEE